MSIPSMSDANHAAEIQDSSRRAFLKQAGAPALSTSSLAMLPGRSLAAPVAQKPPETLAKLLYDTLTAEQKEHVSFPWDHVDKNRGLLRTRIVNNWKITKPSIKSCRSRANCRLPASTT